MDEQDLARKLRNPALLKNVMGSRDGQALLRLLNQDGAGFRQAVRAAAEGDSADMERRLRQLTQSPDSAALLDRVREAVERYGGV